MILEQSKCKNEKLVNVLSYTLKTILFNIERRKAS